LFTIAWLARSASFTRAPIRKAPSGLDLDISQTGNALEVDDAGRRLEPLLEVIDQVDPSGLIGTPGLLLNEVLGLGQCGGTRDFEAIHLD
jgi:hypothetical protein